MTNLNQTDDQEKVICCSHCFREHLASQFQRYLREGGPCENGVSGTRELFGSPPTAFLLFLSNEASSRPWVWLGAQANATFADLCDFLEAYFPEWKGAGSFLMPEEITSRVNIEGEPFKVSLGCLLKPGDRFHYSMLSDPTDVHEIWVTHALEKAALRKPVEMIFHADEPNSEQL